MRIAFVSHSARLGGAEFALCELIEGLARRGAAESEVILPQRGPLAQRLARAGAAVRVLRSYGWATLRATRLPLLAMTAFDVLAVARLVVRFARRRPDLIVTNSLINPCGALAARIVGIRHLWLVNEFGDLDHGYRFLLGMPRTLALVGRLSTGILACSHAVGERLESCVPAGKIAVAYYAVAMAPGRPKEPRPGGPAPVRLLLLGKKHEGKGQLEAVRALALVRRTGLDARLRLVGDGDPRFEARLARLWGDLGVTDAVESVSFTPDPVAEIDAADILLMCSRAEGFGRVTVEAMRRVRPVIGSRAGATTELLEASRGGLLYPPGDAGTLAECVARLCNDPEQARGLALAGARWAAEHCTPDGYVEAFLALTRTSAS